MKNITVFTVLVIILFTFAANISTFGQQHLISKHILFPNQSRYSFSIGPQFGILYGQVLEYVYPTDTKGEFLSELRWDAKPVFYTGFLLDFGRTDIMSGAGFFSTLSFKAGFGGDSGIMEDRDWQSVENAELTNFSKHTNKSNEFLWLELTAGASIPIKSYFYIKPFLNGSLIRLSFSARDGYTKYAREKTQKSKTYYDIDDNPEVKDISGECINYLQDWFIIAAGLEVGTKYFHPFSFALSFKITPLTFNRSRDNHILRETTFLDFTRYGLFIEPGGSFSFSAGRIDLSLDISYHYMGTAEGKTYWQKRGSDNYYSDANKSGAGFSLLDSRILIKIRF